jgi:hypothetical protein
MGLDDGRAGDRHVRGTECRDREVERRNKAACRLDRERKGTARGSHQRDDGQYRKYTSECT